MRMSWNGLLK
ncbi:unnamed protein product [Leptidea sinapis]|uniref:Uncharacterized protein n=1 Tax=Leptidea sinapis TaxID=189913 RepID=A0A5E4PTW2_9NEOP|nr:unnamed protein product [Leptidea sinapis]